MLSEKVSEMPQDEKAVKIIRQRIQVLERRMWLNKRYGNNEASRVHEAVLRELRRILAKIEKESCSLNEEVRR